MTTYEEALIDVKKLKEAAEIEAKNSILEAVSPYIKSIIAREVSNLSSPLFEEEDLLSAQPTGIEMSPMTTAPVSAPVGGTLNGTPPVSPVEVEPGEEAPIKASGVDAMNMPLPGPDGKLVVDFDDLFVASSEPATAVGDASPASAEGEASLTTPEQPIPVAAGDMAIPGTEQPPVELPSSPKLQQTQPLQGQLPMAETDQAITYETFKENIRDLALKMDKVSIRGGNIPSLVKEVLQDKIFTLYEQLENLAENGTISENVLKLNENRLEFLYQQLKEANVDNTYNKTIQKEQTDMKTPSLKEFAAQMIDQDGVADDVLPGGDVTSPADSFSVDSKLKVRSIEGQDKAEKGASDHAIKLTEPSVTLKTLEEELKDALAEETLAAEPGKQDLAGAASSIPDEKVGDVDTTKSTSVDKTEEAAKVTLSETEETVYEVDDKELAEAVRSLKKESIVKQIRALKEQLANAAIEECGGMEQEDAMMGGVPGGTGPVSGAKPAMEDVEINFNFDLSDLEGLEDMSKSLGGGGDDVGGLGGDMDMDVGSSDDMMGGDMGDDQIEIVDDEDEEEGPAGMPVPSTEKEQSMPSMVAESKKVKVLRAQLLESQLWNAKVLYANKFLQREDLSKKQKHKIVEYLDKATTLNEAKTIYGRIKSLTENAKKKMTSSGSSQVVGSGSATLQEQASEKLGEGLYENAMLEDVSRQRLMELAGIKKKG